MFRVLVPLLAAPLLLANAAPPATAKKDAPIPEQIDGAPITRIGKVVEHSGITLIDGSERIRLDGLGWEHHG